MARLRIIQVSLELQIGADPIQGELAMAGEPSRPFVGWLELIGVLDSLASNPKEIPDGIDNPKGDER